LSAPVARAETNMPFARIVLWVATVGALTLALRSVAIGPPPFWFALAVTFGYLSLCGFGVVFPRCEMFADVIACGPTGDNRVALTFDDGPDPETTPKVLEALRRHGYRATFFVIARKAEQQPELIKAILNEGHELGLHGYEHDRLTAWRVPSRIADDIRRAQEALRVITQQQVFWYRPPIGHVSPRTAAAVRRTDVELVAWSVRCLDGLRGSNPARVLACLRRKLHDGAIVMLHDASERGDFVPATVTLLDELLGSVAERGFTSVTLSELLVQKDLDTHASADST
jgi:peptidoglycan/xylan/chitin deacetylase (PgdA/CDA1 family)